MAGEGARVYVELFYVKDIFKPDDIFVSEEISYFVLM